MGYYTSYSLEIQHPDTCKPLADEQFVALIIDGLRKFRDEADYCLAGPDGMRLRSCEGARKA